MMPVAYQIWPTIRDLLVFLLYVNLSAAVSGSTTQTKSEPVALHEAEILIYLLPVAEQIRLEGMDIGWELQTTPELNQADYYIFWVYNAKRTGTGSVTIGYYTVNKHTADVWDDGSEEFVASHELEGVQKILRSAHHIDEDTIKQYRSRPVEATKLPKK